jgi:hypothetical protein
MAAAGKRNFTDRFPATKLTRGRSHHDPNLPNEFIILNSGLLIIKLPVTGI